MAVKEFESIPGLRLVDCPSFIDDRGFLMEILRAKVFRGVSIPGDDFGHCQAATIQQVYLVVNPEPTVRAFHAHKELIDYFCIVQGSAIFAFADDRGGEVNWLGMVGFAAAQAQVDREDVPGMPGVQRLVCSARKPQMIVVPAGVYHGWASLEPNTIMVSCASTRYNTDEPDERRISPDSLDGVFDGSPWEVEGK